MTRELFIKYIDLRTNLLANNIISLVTFDAYVDATHRIKVDSDGDMERREEILGVRTLMWSVTFADLTPSERTAVGDEFAVQFADYNDHLTRKYACVQQDWLQDFLNDNMVEEFTVVVRPNQWWLFVYYR